MEKQLENEDINSLNSVFKNLYKINNLSLDNYKNFWKSVYPINRNKKKRETLENKLINITFTELQLSKGMKQITCIFIGSIYANKKKDNCWRDLYVG